jgi:hypothetical protein
MSHAYCTRIVAREISVDFMHVACDWHPHGYILHALVASTVQSRQFFESMLPEQKFEFKNEETI